MDINQLSALIKRRRAIYPQHYTGEVIPDQKIVQILENANWAPSHRKTEPWRFHILKGSALEDLGDWMANFYKVRCPEDEFSEARYKKLKYKPRKASHIIVICWERDPEERIPEWEELAAVACSVQNLWLSVTAMKLGGYWSTPEPSLHLNEFLNLGPRERSLGLFYLGVPNQSAQNIPSQRGDINNKIYWRGRE